MRMLSRVVLLMFPLSCAMMAQNWEVGGSGGYSFYRDVNVTSGSATGTAGLQQGYAFGALLGNDLYRFIGGEVRYTYLRNDLRVESGSSKTTAGADAHALHYDLLIHAAPKESAVRPFFALGAGVKYFRGTGAEPSYQPLANFAILTHANQAVPLLSFGGGVKIALSPRTLLRLDFRDYATTFPDKLLVLAPGARAGGWLHDFVVLVGVSKAF